MLSRVIALSDEEIRAVIKRQQEGWEAQQKASRTPLQGDSRIVAPSTLAPNIESELVPEKSLETQRARVITIARSLASMIWDLSTEWSGGDRKDEKRTSNANTYLNGITKLQDELSKGLTWLDRQFNAYFTGFRKSEEFIEELKGARQVERKRKEMEMIFQRFSGFAQKTPAFYSDIEVKLREVERAYSSLVGERVGSEARVTSNFQPAREEIERLRQLILSTVEGFKSFRARLNTFRGEIDQLGGKGSFDRGIVQQNRRDSGKTGKVKSILDVGDKNKILDNANQKKESSPLGQNAIEPKAPKKRYRGIGGGFTI